MQFSRNNNIVKLCLQGIGMEENGNPNEAGRLFFQAWNEATNDFEKFLAAHYVSRHQKNVRDKLEWLETTLKHALKVYDETVASAFLSLYLNIAKCYEELGDPAKTKKNLELAA
jgi:rifampin ADP-ribosylating transferase